MEKTVSHRKIFLNNFSNAMGPITFVVISFFMMPFYLRTLGLTLYGIWHMVQSVVNYMSLMDMGMQSAVQKYVAECQGKEDRESLSQVILSALVFYSLIALLGGIVLTVLVWEGLPLLNVKPEHFSTVRLLLLIMGIDMLLTFPGTVSLGVLTGMQLFYVTNSIRIILLIITATTIYLALSSGHGVIAMASIGLLGNVIAYILLYGLVRWRYHLFSIRRRHFKLAKLREMVTFGCKTFLIVMAGRIKQSSPPLIVGYFFSAAWVPFYTVPANLIYYSRVVLLSLTRSFLPLFSNLEAKNDVESMRSVYIRYSRYTGLCIFPLLTLVMIYGEPFLRAWMGSEFAEQGGPIIVLLSLALLIYAVNPLGPMLLIGTARQKIIVLTGFASAGLFLGLGILLINQYRLPGLAAAFLIGELIPVYYVLRRSLSTIKLSFVNYFLKSLASLMLVAILTGSFLWIIKQIHYPVGYLDLALQLAFGVFFFAALAYSIVVTREERAFLASFLMSFGRTMKPAHWRS
jgi:O-antigen/teichoic acid export membrane protein